MRNRLGAVEFGDIALPVGRPEPPLVPPRPSAVGGDERAGISSRLAARATTRTGGGSRPPNEGWVRLISGT